MPGRVVVYAISGRMPMERFSRNSMVYLIIAQPAIQINIVISLKKTE
jgi:hypothetical protein